MATFAATSYDKPGDTFYPSLCAPFLMPTWVVEYRPGRRRGQKRAGVVHEKRHAHTPLQHTLDGLPATRANQVVLAVVGVVVSPRRCKT